MRKVCFYKIQFMIFVFNGIPFEKVIEIKLLSVGFNNFDRILKITEYQ